MSTARYDIMIVPFSQPSAARDFADNHGMRYGKRQDADMSEKWVAWTEDNTVANRVIKEVCDPIGYAYEKDDLSNVEPIAD